MVCRATILAIAVSAVLLLPAGPVRAAADATIEQQIQEGAELIISGLRLLLDRIPQYQAPEVLPNGDIIIRRTNPVKPAPKSPGTGQDGTTKL